jgi:hypothetical protein
LPLPFNSPWQYKNFPLCPPFWKQPVDTAIKRAVPGEVSGETRLVTLESGGNG